MKNKQILQSAKDFIEDFIKKTVNDSMTHAVKFKVATIFQSEESCIRLVTAVLLGAHEN